MDTRDFTRSRILVLRFSGLLLFALVLLAGRLGYLHLTLHEDARAAVAAARDRTRVIPARRGEIYDRHGRALVLNAPALRVDVWPPKLRGLDTDVGDQITRQRRIADLLAPAVQASPDELRVALGGDKNRVLGHPVGDPDTQEWIRAGLPRGGAFHGLDVAEVSVRRYPWGATAGNLLGFLDAEGAGASGLERSLEPWLEGVDGERSYRVDHGGREQVDPRAPVIEPHDGLDVTLTLDVKLQQLVEQELLALLAEQEGERAAGVVLDARSGDLLALASVPALDPDDRRTIHGEAMRIAPVQDQYNPGSSFKPLMMAIALDLGLAHTADPPILCDRFEPLPKIRDTHPKDHPLTLPEILIHSSNIGMAKIFARLAPEGHPLERAAMESLDGYLARLGLKSAPGLPVPAESAGSYPAFKHWDRDHFPIQASRGQAIAISAVQMAAATNTLADGLYRRPRLVSAVSRPEPGLREELPAELPAAVFHHDTAERVREWMRLVVEKGNCQELLSLGLPVAGKTGTADLEDDLESGDEMHSYVALVPAHDPVVTVVLALRRPRHARWASQSVAPAMGRLIRSMAPYLGLDLEDPAG